MNEHATLNTIDYCVFFAYIGFTLFLGFAVSRGARQKMRDYFLGDKKLPWYVVGTSMVASDISSETFIANVGIAYQYGMVVATSGWNSWIIYSIFLFVFLPYYVRSGLYTMPEFLERRYNATCRYLFAFSLVIGYIFTLLAGSLYAGGLAIERIFELKLSADLNTNIAWGIVFFAVTTGAYTIYGGMKSSAWTDFLQMLVLLSAGVLLPILALQKAGGISQLVHDYPDKFQIFLPPTHERFPATGVFTGFLSVGLWYTCSSQHIVQRVLSAKNEWHARMGVVSAGFLRIITPLFFVLPGIAAIRLFPNLEKPDQAYLMLVKSLIPTGLKGLVLAGMAAALMATVSTVLNATSTLLTIDLYKKLRPRAGDREQVLVGMVAGAIVLSLSVLIGFVYITRRDSLFVLVQQVFFYIAPPFAVVFLLGLVWRRANGTAAIVTIISGFSFLLLLQKGIWFAHIPPLWDAIPWLAPYKQAYQHSALLTWVFSMAVMIVTSLLTGPPPAEKIDGIIWNGSYLSLPPEEQQRYGGWRDFRLWWVLFVGSVLSIYGFFVWFEFVRQ
ncbi:MAG TPA: sodium/solute symporter [Lacipirellulaceae bacterium]|nr:sodium/solute symporter [Lacipirellulaceae bacterium]